MQKKKGAGKKGGRKCVSHHSIPYSNKTRHISQITDNQYFISIQLAINLTLNNLNKKWQ